MKTRIFSALFLSVGLVLVVRWAITAQGPESGDHPNQNSAAVLLPGPEQMPPSVSTARASSPVQEVVVALGMEPDTLYVYGTQMYVASHVLNALMDGPITQHSSYYQPVILVKVPYLEDGDAVVNSVSVVSGTLIVDDNDTVIPYAGPTTMLPQMVVTFTLRSGVRWSDGEELTAQDSFFGFQVACHLDTTTYNHHTCERTAAYETLDNLTVRWTGLPGFLDPSYPTYFWTPLPYHVLSTTTPLDILNSPYGRSPLGWGPFRMVEWAAGDHITVERNPYYWRSGYPRLDRVTFRWFNDAATLRQAILRGEVQVVTQDGGGLLGPQELLDLQQQGVVHLILAASGWWEHLGFDLLPADSRYVFFADRQVRQAVAYALDRQRMVNEVLHGLGRVAQTYVIEEHPAYTTTIHTYPYSPTQAANLLTAAGWVDADGDGIREKDGRPFVFTHTTTDRLTRRQLGAIIQENLAAVGISTTLNFIPPDEFFTLGPESPVWGRKFDTAEYMEPPAMNPRCHLYLSSAIPGDWNGWNGDNYVGYNNSAYDQVCLQALGTITRTEAIPRHQQAMIMLSEDLPVLPLFYDDIAVLADPALDPPPSPDPIESELWNIWEWGITAQAVVAPTESEVLTGSGGMVMATFGAGTFTETVVVTYTPQLPVEPEGNLRGIGLFYELAATSQDSGQPVQPRAHYTMTLSYADVEAQAALVDESTLALYHWDGSQWVKEPSSVVDTGANTVTAMPNHLSMWAILGRREWRVFLPAILKNS